MSVLFGRLRVDERIWHPLMTLLLVLSLFSLIPAPATGQWVHTKLNAPLAYGEEITSFAISPDGGNVVYRLEHQIPVGNTRTVQRAHHRWGTRPARPTQRRWSRDIL